MGGFSSYPPFWKRNVTNWRFWFWWRKGSLSLGWQLWYAHMANWSSLWSRCFLPWCYQEANWKLGKSRQYIIHNINIHYPTLLYNQNSIERATSKSVTTHHFINFKILLLVSCSLQILFLPASFAERMPTALPLQSILNIGLNALLLLCREEEWNKLCLLNGYCHTHI